MVTAPSGRTMRYATTKTSPKTMTEDEKRTRMFRRITERDAHLKRLSLDDRRQLCALIMRLGKLTMRGAVSVPHGELQRVLGLHDPADVAWLVKAMTRQRPTGMRYIPYIPKKVPAGKVLVHNRVKRTAPDHKPGVNGFRCWLQPTTEGVKECRCGWAPHLTHYKPA